MPSTSTYVHLRNQHDISRISFPLQSLAIRRLSSALRCEARQRKQVRSVWAVTSSLNRPLRHAYCALCKGCVCQKWAQALLHLQASTLHLHLDQTDQSVVFPLCVFVVSEHSQQQEDVPLRAEKGT